MQAEVDRRRREFNALMEQVETIEDTISDEVGLTEVLHEGDQLGAQREAMVQSLEELAVSKTSRQEQIQTLEGSRNQYYKQAVDKMKRFLASLDEARLAERARRTPEPDDDALVEEITKLGEQLEQTRNQEAILARERQSWSERLHGLQQVLVQFRSTEYDSRRSLFSAGFDLDVHVARYLEGRESGQQLWNAIGQHQHFAPTWQDQSGGLGQVLDSELSQVLLRSLAEVAGAAMRGAAYRGMERRGPARHQKRIQVGRPRFPRRGFTNGRGF
jgi:hypothetical protein